MRENIIRQMEDVVENFMTGFKADFYTYDKPEIEDEATTLPVIWIVSKLHTRLLRLGEYRGLFFDESRVRFNYAHGDDGFSYMLEPGILNKEDQIFLITNENEDIRRITEDMAREVIRDYVNSAVEAWRRKHGWDSIKKGKIKIYFNRLTLSQLRGLVEECHQHGEDSLMKCLKRFRRWRPQHEDHRVEVFYRPLSKSFGFYEMIDGRMRLGGEIVFHGWPETGYMKNGAMQIEPSYGWHMHT